MPTVFPESMDCHTSNTAYQNPVIGDTQEQTYRNVGNILSLLTGLALPENGSPAGMSLDESQSWGFVTIVESIRGAMAFEEKYRFGGGQTLDNNTKD